MSILRYIAARLSEASTWAALAALLAGVHVSIDPGLWQHIVDTGIALSGLAGFLIPEQ
ncbi:MAG TPA: hypothetical protein VKB68_09305 [Stellaceae bacterium]|nr:hypothetical protein [Stellaceae bacterium]